MIGAGLEARCPHCGGSLEVPAPESTGSPPGPLRYDLEELVALATKEKAYDETVKVRVSQEDIRKLVEKRRRKAK